jgi:hypothetical protein
MVFNGDFECLIVIWLVVEKPNLTSFNNGHMILVGGIPTPLKNNGVRQWDYDISN